MTTNDSHGRHKNKIQYRQTYCVPQCILALAVLGKTSCKQTILSADEYKLGCLQAMMAFTLLYQAQWITSECIQHIRNRSLNTLIYQCTGVFAVI